MNLSFFKKTDGNHIEFFQEGDDYYTRYLQMIDEAQSSIHLQTYIFKEDAFGQQVIRALIRSAERGVKVYVLIDSVGSFDFSRQAEERLKEAGIYFCRFNGIRIRWLGQWGRRLHHKVLLTDHERAIIGGINVISESYLDSQKVPHQLDFAVYLEGPVATDLTRYCQLIFSKACKLKLKFPDPRLEPRTEFPDGVALQISINDWIYRRWQITRLYSQLTKVANREIIIVNSYFFPRKKFMKQLKAAAERGVRVRLILPRFSDWPSYVKATQYLYAYFLKNKIEVYEWKSSILHGKLALIDGTWSTIGSFNLNYTSYQQNLEMNVNVFDPAFNQKLNQQLQKYMDEGCEKINSSTFLEKADWMTKASRFFFYIILSLVANFSIGIAFQIEEGRGMTRKFITVGVSIIFFIIGVMGLMLPLIPGTPFLIVSLLLICRQIAKNNVQV
ncbi:phospholipase D-like domain-containing protein [Pseudobdellovibrio exovorus]|uniref:PLD phosphodiesterase domain-containing protein n=1 Tax=Pseudobdellovibrio exovorus JSS TaxID=1184267 RepID=M4V812_9BACT|nr:phospholipase D-like domain-containing protein [Pseudobdellovibrio exovorus]AGH94575.1 hypothetical protein A11Q_355 [Pseudobdellovibrio exovorus JSS]